MRKETIILCIYSLFKNAVSNQGKQRRMGDLVLIIYVQLTAPC